MAYTIGQLMKSDSEDVYVLNNTIKTSKHKRPTHVAFEVFWGNQARSVSVLDSWIPQNLAMQAPKSVIVESPSFRQALSRGHIVLVEPKEADKILGDPDAKIEEQRLTNKQNMSQQELGDIQPIMPRDIAAEKDADEHPNVSPMIKDLCGRDDNDPVAIYARLKSTEGTLNKDEYKYLDRNLAPECRNEKVDALIKKNLAS